MLLTINSKVNYFSLKIKKLNILAGEKLLHFDSSQPIVTRGSRVSRAPPHHALPAFLILNGNLILQIFKVKFFLEDVHSVTSERKMSFL